MSLTLGTELELPELGGTVDAALRSQRARMAAMIDAFDDDAWRGPTRCSEWNVQQVVLHLCGANRACVRVLRGDPGEKVEENFDPRRSPNAYVDQRAGEPVAKTAADFVASSEKLFEAMTFMTTDRPTARVNAVWGVPVDWRLFVTHIFWDAWVHERDILLPMAEPHNASEDEHALAVVYGFVPAGVFPVLTGATLDETLALTGPGAGTYRVHADPDGVVVTAGAEPAGEGALRGDAASVGDAIAGREPLLGGALGVPQERVAGLGGLAAFLRS